MFSLISFEIEFVEFAPFLNLLASLLTEYEEEMESENYLKWEYVGS